MTEQEIEKALIAKLGDLKYTLRQDIRDRAALKRNFRERFQKLNRVTLRGGEFTRLLDEIVTADVFAAARMLRERNSFTRDDDTPLNYTLVDTRDWCKNDYEVGASRPSSKPLPPCRTTSPRNAASSRPNGPNANNSSNASCWSPHECTATCRGLRGRA